MTRTEIRQKANSEMEKRRLRAEAEAEARTAEIYKKLRRWRRYAECWQEQLPSFLSL